MEENKIFLSSNIKHLRILNKKTQEEIGEVCNKTNTAVSNWEKGIREPDAVDLSALSTYFNVSIDDLMLKDLRFYEDNSENCLSNKTQLLFNKTKDILSDDDRATMEFIMQKTINNYEKNKNEKGD